MIQKIQSTAIAFFSLTRSPIPTFAFRAHFPLLPTCAIFTRIFCNRTLTANIRRRRGSKVAINLPIFRDTNTPRPFIDPTIPYNRNIYAEDPGQCLLPLLSIHLFITKLMLPMITSEAKNGAALPDHIYMDAMGFGMGCCCLQITFQACNVDEARRVYDALVPVGPIMVCYSLDLGKDTQGKLLMSKMTF